MSAEAGELQYAGSELGLFAAATRWKRYVARSLRTFVGTSVLEVGAGIGGTTQALCGGRRGRWVCLEPDAGLARQIDARVQGGDLPAFCETRTGTLRALPGEERFDTILYIDVLEHIEDDAGELERAAGHLAPGGHLVVLAPAHQWLFSPFDRAIGHWRRYSRRSLLALSPRGSRVVHARYLDSVGLLASLGNRLLLHSASPTPAQIRLWDAHMVPLSERLDPLLGHRLGKTVVVVWRRP